VALDMGGHLVGGHLPALHALLAPGTLNWILLALASPVVLWAGWPFFVRGVQSVRTRNLNMFTLIALGTGVAWLYSVVATVAPGLFPLAFRGAGGAVPVYFEPAAVIVVLVLVGQVLELRARDVTGGAIKALLGLAPRTALRVGPDGSDAEAAQHVAQLRTLLVLRGGDERLERHPALRAVSGSLLPHLRVHRAGVRPLRGDGATARGNQVAARILAKALEARGATEEVPLALVLERVRTAARIDGHPAHRIRRGAARPRPGRFQRAHRREEPNLRLDPIPTRPTGDAERRGDSRNDGLESRGIDG